MGHALVADPGGARLVGVDARDDDDRVLHLGLDLRQPRDVIAHRILVMRRTGTDDQHQFFTFSGKHLADGLIAFFLDLDQFP